MAFRRFKKAYRFTGDDGRITVIPRGWAGELGDKVANAADKGGFTVAVPKAEQPKPHKADTPKAESK